MLKSQWTDAFSEKFQAQLDSLQNVWKAFLNHKDLTFRSAAFILCWKLISHLPREDILEENYYKFGTTVNHATFFADLMLPYIRENIGPYKNTEEFGAFKANLARHANFLKFVFTSRF